MSYFVVWFTSKDPVPEEELYRSISGLEFVPIFKSQPRLQCLLREVEHDPEVRGAEYLVADETIDTSSNLVTEISKQVLIENLPLEHTRLSAVATMAERRNASLLAWWSPTCDPGTVQPVRTQTSMDFMRTILAQLEDSGDINVELKAERRG